MTNITLVHNANKRAEGLLGRDNVVAAKKDLIYHIKNNHKIKFATALQIYVTKIGLVLEECVVHCSKNDKMRANTYLGSIEFICKRILQNQPLYKIMKDIEVNSSGNADKHGIQDIKIDIDFTLKHYNILISEIIEHTGLKAFKECYLSKSPKDRDIPILEESKHHKFFTILGIKFQLKMNQNYEVDPYNKTISSKLTLYWPEASPGKFVSVIVKSEKTGKKLFSKKHIDISSANSKKAMNLNYTESDLDRRVLRLNVLIKVEEIGEKYVYSTGVLFWKKDYYQEDYIVIKKHEEQISQYFKPKT